MSPANIRDRPPFFITTKNVANPTVDALVEFLVQQTRDVEFLTPLDRGAEPLNRFLDIEVPVTSHDELQYFTSCHGPSEDVRGFDELQKDDAHTCIVDPTRVDLDAKEVHNLEASSGIIREAFLQDQGESRLRLKAIIKPPSPGCGRPSHLMLTRSSFTAAHSCSVNFFVSAFCGSGSTCGVGAGSVSVMAVVSKR